MSNHTQNSRRNFFQNIWIDQSSKISSHPSILNPINSLNSQLAGILPPLEHEVLFLNRSSFGIRPADYARIKSIGIENYLEEQLDYESIDNSELENIIDAVYPLVNATLTEIVEHIEAGNALGEDRASDAAIQLISATMFRQLYSKHQLFEVMVEFWSNHFNVDIGKGLVLILKTHEDKNIIRQNTFSTFRQILHADAKSSAMMFYLDNFSNTKNGPNENYARELMELHTLGVNGGYSEADVKEVARCFTGWSIGENDAGFFEFYPSTHDFGNKLVLGHTINNQVGIRDGEQVLDILADSSTTAGFIADKMIRRFCSDFPDIELTKAVAKSYLSTDGDIKAMLRTIFHSRQFLDSVDMKFKRPIEFVSSSLRTVDIESSQSTIEQKFFPLNILINEYSDSGQIPFFWSPPTGYPDVASYWTNISTLLRRINLSNGISLGDLVYQNQDNDDTFFSDLVDYNYQAIIQDAVTAHDIVLMIENTILYREMLDQDRALLVTFLLEDGSDISVQRIKAVIGIVLSSTYFQLR